MIGGVSLEGNRRGKWIFQSIIPLIMFYLIKAILKSFTQPSVSCLTKSIEDNTELEISHCRINKMGNQKMSISALFMKSQW